MLYLQHIICIFATYNLNLCAIYLYLQYIIFYLQYIRGPTNQISCVQITDVYVYGISKNILLGMKWVAVARHGLILWENGATGPNIILK